MPVSHTQLLGPVYHVEDVVQCGWTQCRYQSMSHSTDSLSKWLRLTSDIPEVQCSECLVVSWGAVCWCSKPRCCQYSCLYSSDYLQQTCGACLHHSHCNEYSQVNATRRPPTVSSGFKMLDCNLPCLRRYHND